jgi:hypothetical protein
MHFLQFVSALIAHLAWPVTVLILACKFRLTIIKLLLRLRRIKGKGWQFEFYKELEQLTEKAEEAELLSPPPQQLLPTTVRLTQQDVQNELHALAADAPQAAIALARTIVETNLADAVSKVPGQPPSESAVENARRLSDAGRLKKEFVDVIGKMQQLRNRVMQGLYREITSANAKQFVHLTLLVLAQLQRSQ